MGTGIKGKPCACRTVKVAFLFFILALVFPAGQAHAVKQVHSLCADDFSKIINSHDENWAQKLGETVLKEINDSYYDVDRNNPARIAKWNKTLERTMRELPLTGDVRGRLGGLSWQEITALYEKIINHPVGDYRIVSKYDPEGNIGFCFGRAMIAHIEALETGLAKENIRKIWAIGTMKYDNILWNHHVATMVRGKNGIWYVLDPEYGQVLKMATWMKRVKKMDADNKLEFFVTNPNRFGPESDLASRRNVAPLPLELGTTTSQRNDTDAPRPYNGYFQDEMEYTRREAAELKEHIKATAKIR